VTKLAHAAEPTQETERPPAKADGGDGLGTAQAELAEAEAVVDRVKREQESLPFRQHDVIRRMTVARNAGDVFDYESAKSEQNELNNRATELGDELFAGFERVNKARAAIAAARRGPAVTVAAGEQLVAQAQAELDVMTAEQLSIRSTIDTALQNGDATALAAARSRADLLPSLLVGAQAAVLMAEARHAEAMFESMPERIEDAYALLAPLKTALDEAQRAYNEAQGNWGRERAAQSAHRQRAAEKRREAEALLSAQSRRESAPVVRSIPHARIGV